MSSPHVLYPYPIVSTIALEKAISQLIIRYCSQSTITHSIYQSMKSSITHSILPRSMFFSNHFRSCHALYPILITLIIASQLLTVSHAISEDGFCPMMGVACGYFIWPTLLCVGNNTPYQHNHQYFCRSTPFLTQRILPTLALALALVRRPTVSELDH